MGSAARACGWRGAGGAALTPAAAQDARGDLDGKAHVGRVHDCWVYMYAAVNHWSPCAAPDVLRALPRRQSTVTGLPNESLPRVGGFCVYLFAREFHPPKFGALVEVATTTYRATGEPTRVLEVYLGAFTLGKCSTDHGSWAVASFAAGSPLMGANAKVCAALRDVSRTRPGSYFLRSMTHHASERQALVRQFGDATILLWAAMVLKKRCAEACRPAHTGPSRLTRTPPQRAVLW